VQEQLRLILAAEVEARQQVDAAQRNGHLEVAQAEENSRRQVQAARDERPALIRAVQAQLTAAADQQAQRLREDAGTKTAALRQLAESRLERAVDAVLRCLLERDDGDAW